MEGLIEDYKPVLWVLFIGLCIILGIGRKWTYLITTIIFGSVVLATFYYPTAIGDIASKIAGPLVP